MASSVEMASPRVMVAALPNSPRHSQTPRRACWLLTAAQPSTCHGRRAGRAQAERAGRAHGGRHGKQGQLKPVQRGGKG
eukprot:208328-Rhodomonas_salina.1